MMLDIFNFKTWTPKTLEQVESGPCNGNCCAAAAMDNQDGINIWSCRHGSWRMLEQRNLVESHLPHSGEQCPGNCKQHPLTDSLFLSIRNAMDAGLGMGDIVYNEVEQMIAQETPEQRAARLAADAAYDLASQKGIERYSVTKKAEKWCGKEGQMKFRVPRPCKYASLFLQRICAACESKVPEGQNCCSAGKCREPLAGCWSHEHSQSCIYVHPDEPQWSTALNGTLDYDRAQQIFFLKGSKPVENRFVNLVRNERSRPVDKRPRHN